ncbi:MAG: hypothetical protein IKS39_00900 [Clostridia bacterium]|nr:hypothetical protein [Clostridia bacterium]
MKYYIGVDGGGTKTAYALFDENKNMLASVDGKGSNHENLPGAFDEASDYIIDGINALCSKAEIELKDVSFTLMGLAGIDHPYQHDKMCALLREKGLDRFEIFNDGFIVVKAGSETGAAIGYNCGTGVCCNAVDSGGNMQQLMGLGDFTGDVSGGVNIAVKAFEFVYNELFLNMGKTLITQLVKEKYGIEKREDLLALVEKLENGEDEYIRSFVGFFFEAAKVGDAPALNYCAVMAERGAQAISALANQLQFDGEEIEVVLSGSINVKLDNAPYIEMLKEKAQSLCGKKLKFTKLTAMPVIGCINWILQEFAN